MSDNEKEIQSSNLKPKFGIKRKNSNTEVEQVQKIAKKELPIEEQENNEASEEKSGKQVLALAKRHRKRKRHYFNAIRAQMEFYFGDANLSKDRYLKKLVLQDPFVPLDVFMTFNKMKALAKSVDEIAKSLSNSDMLVLDEAGVKVRRKTTLPENRNVDEKTIYVESLPLIATHDWVREIFERFGPVSYVSLPKYSKSRKIKEFGFVEYENESSVAKAISAFKDFNGVLNMETLDPADLSSIKSFIKEQKKENTKTDMETLRKPSNTENSSKSISSVDKSNGESTDDDKLNVKSKKKLRKKKKKSKCLKEREKEIILVADAAYFELKILPKSDWKRLRNKYLNLQRQKVGELKRKAWQERQLQQQEQQQLFSSSEKDCDREESDSKKMSSKISGSERKINAGMNMNFYGAGNDESVTIKGTKEAKHNPALERAPHFSYEKGLIVEIALLQPCVNIKEFKANMRQYASVKYVDIKEGSMLAHLRLESATAAEEFVQRINSAEYVCRMLTEEEDSKYWKKIDQDREAKLNKQIKLPQKRGREKIKKLITQHIRFNDEE